MKILDFGLAKIMVVQDPAMYGRHHAGALQVVAAPPDAQTVGQVTTLAEESFEVVKTVLEHETDDTTRRAWALEQAAKVGRSLASQMIAFGLGDEQLRSTSRPSPRRTGGSSACSTRRARSPVRRSSSGSTTPWICS